MSYRVIITDPALETMRAQARYISEDCESPDAALRWLDQVFDSANQLGEMPRRCPLAHEDADRVYEVRARFLGDYLMLFTIVEETRTVWILGFRHGHQRPQPERLPEDLPGTGAGP